MGYYFLRDGRPNMYAMTAVTGILTFLYIDAYWFSLSKYIYSWSI